MVRAACQSTPTANLMMVPNEKLSVMTVLISQAMK